MFINRLAVGHFPLRVKAALLLMVALAVIGAGLIALRVFISPTIIDSQNVYSDWDGPGGVPSGDIISVRTSARIGPGSYPYPPLPRPSDGGSGFCGTGTQAYDGNFFGDRMAGASPAASNWWFKPPSQGVPEANACYNPWNLGDQKPYSKPQGSYESNVTTARWLNPNVSSVLPAGWARPVGPTLTGSPQSAPAFNVSPFGAFLSFQGADPVTCGNCDPATAGSGDTFAYQVKFRLKHPEAVNQEPNTEGRWYIKDARLTYKCDGFCGAWLDNSDGSDVGNYLPYPCFANGDCSVDPEEPPPGGGPPLEHGWGGNFSNTAGTWYRSMPKEVLKARLDHTLAIQVTQKRYNSSFANPPALKFRLQIIYEKRTSDPPPEPNAGYVQPQKPDGSPNTGPHTPPGFTGCGGGWHFTPSADVNVVPSAFNGRLARYCWAFPGVSTTQTNPVISTSPPGGSIGNVRHNFPAGRYEGTTENCGPAFSGGAWRWDPRTVTSTTYKHVYRKVFGDGPAIYEIVYNDAHPNPTPSGPDPQGHDYSLSAPAPGYPGEYEFDRTETITSSITQNCIVTFSGDLFASYEVNLSGNGNGFRNNQLNFPGVGTTNTHVYFPHNRAAASKFVTAWTTTGGPGRLDPATGLPEVHPGDFISYTINVSAQTDPALDGLTPSDRHPWAEVSYSISDPSPIPACMVVQGGPSPGGGTLTGPDDSRSSSFTLTILPDPNPCADRTIFTNTATVSYNSNQIGGSTSGSAQAIFRIVFWPWLQTVDGDVYARRNLNSAPLGRAGRGTTPNASYIVSAGGNLNQFNSLRNWIFFSTSASPSAYGFVIGGGQYGTLPWPYEEDSLWPDRRLGNADQARRYYAAGYQTSLPPAGSPDLSQGNRGGTVYSVAGGTRISAAGINSYRGRGTIYARGALYIDGNITRGGGPAARDFQHSLGIIAEGPIYISPAVTRIDAVLYSADIIQTATSRTTNVLTVNGMMVGRTFHLSNRAFVDTGCRGGATGSGTCPAASPAEIYVYFPQLIATPPPGFQNVASVIEGAPLYTGERSPIIGSY